MEDNEENLKEETPATVETEEETPKNDEFKFNLAFLISFAVAIAVFFIALGFGEVMYGVAAFAFTGICVQFTEFYLKSKKIPLLVTGCLSGAAALTMFVLSIVALCVA